MKLSYCKIVPVPIKASLYDRVRLWFKESEYGQIKDGHNQLRGVIFKRLGSKVFIVKEFRHPEVEVPQ